MRPVRVLAIPGSLRSRSHNAALLRAVADSAPESLEVTVFEHLCNVPLFDEDVAQAGIPQGVRQLHDALVWSDAVLFATPEYNQAVPGVVKNMIDWVSMGEPHEGFVDKPVAVTGVTTGPWGTRLAQTMLRQMLVSVGAVLLPRPTLYLRDGGGLFDDDGRLIDAKTRERAVALAIALGDFARMFGADSVEQLVAV